MDWVEMQNSMNSLQVIPSLGLSPFSGYDSILEPLLSFYLLSRATESKLTSHLCQKIFLYLGNMSLSSLLGAG